MLGDFFNFFSQSGFMPHIHCYLAKPSLVWSMFVTDLLIGTAYTGISITLYVLIRRIKIPFSAVVLCFGLFIGACGLTHFMEVWTLWHPDYWVAAGIKFVTAAASVGTGIYLFRLRHSIVTVAEAAKLSEQRRLDLEVLTKTLEERVEERTRELQRRESQLRLITDALPALIAYVDKDYRYRFVNKAYESWFGMSRDQLVGRKIDEILGASNQGVLKRYQDAAFAGNAIAFEERVDYPSGGPKIVQGSYVPDRGEDGQIEGVVVLVMDITEQRRAELARKETEIQFEALANSIPEMAWMLDPDGKPVWVNRTWLDFTGASLEDHGDSELSKRVHPDFQEEFQGLWREALHGSRAFEATLPIRSKTGEYRWFLTRAVPIRDHRPVPSRFLGTQTDITEKLKSERELQAAVRSRDELLSICSHELRTPVSIIKLQMQMAQKRIQREDPEAYQPERVRKLVDQTGKQIDRLAKLIEDMLDFSRISAGKLDIVPEKFDLADLVDETLERLKPKFEETGTSVRTSLSRPTIGEWDRMRLEQVLVNLLTNATKYGSGRPITVSLSQTRDELELEVRDEGIGIAPEHQERIFEPYERAVSFNHISGLGMGLYISRQIIRDHGGEIRVESKLQEGSRFTVFLPRITRLASMAHPAPSSPPQPSPDLL